MLTEEGRRRLLDQHLGAGWQVNQPVMLFNFGKVRHKRFVAQYKSFFGQIIRTNFSAFRNPPYSRAFMNRKSVSCKYGLQVAFMFWQQLLKVIWSLAALQPQSSHDWGELWGVQVVWFDAQKPTKFDTSGWFYWVSEICRLDISALRGFPTIFKSDLSHDLITLCMSDRTHGSLVLFHLDQPIPGHSF